MNMHVPMVDGENARDIGFKLFKLFISVSQIWSLAVWYKNAVKLCHKPWGFLVFYCVWTFYLFLFASWKTEFFNGPGPPIPGALDSFLHPLVFLLGTILHQNGYQIPITRVYIGLQKIEFHFVSIIPRNYL